MEWKKRSGPAVSIHDVALPGAGDCQFVFFKYLDLRSGAGAVWRCNLPMVFQKCFKAPTGKPSVFKLFFGNREVVQAIGQPMERPQNPRLQKVPEMQELFEIAEDQGRAYGLLPVLR